MFLLRLFPPRIAVLTIRHLLFRGETEQGAMSCLQSSLPQFLTGHGPSDRPAIKKNTHVFKSGPANGSQLVRRWEQSSKKKNLGIVIWKTPPGLHLPDLAFTGAVVVTLFSLGILR
jgi:hypothetical protein